MSKSVARVKRALEAAGIAAEIREMAEGTRTAAEAAAAVGCELDQIAKSVIFRGTRTDSVVLFITAGGNASILTARRTSPARRWLPPMPPSCAPARAS